MYEIELQEEAILPRERLLAKGPEQLSNQELLAILLRTGNRHHSVFELAQLILQGIKDLSQLKSMTIQELQEIKGIGLVKAIELQAMMELGQRIATANVMKKDRILSARSLAEKKMLEMGDLKQEQLVAIYLDTQNQVLLEKVIFIGCVNRSIAEPREILHHGIRLMATSLILVHNHPSGNIFPSRQDDQFTEVIQDASQLLGIRLLDHLIVSKSNYYSYREQSDILEN